MATVVFFRGNNTVNIMADARIYGLLRADDTIVIIAKNNDRLCQPGDVTRLPPSVGDEVYVVGNGGTTSQSLPVVAQLASATWESDDAPASSRESAIYDSADKHVGIYDMQRDGVIHLWGLRREPRN